MVRETACVMLGDYMCDVGGLHVIVGRLHMMLGILHVMVGV